MKGNRGAWLPHGSWPWQGHRHQQWEQLGTAEPPACGLVMDATRVTETRSSSWEMAPSSHACSSFLLSEVSQPPSAGDIVRVLGWLGGETGLGESDKETKLKIAPRLLACLVIQGRGMETASSHQSFQMLQDVSHRPGHPQGVPAEQPAPRSHEVSSQHRTHVCVPTPRYLCLVSPRTGAAMQPGRGAWGRRNSLCQTWCWHMPSKWTAPWGWSGAVKTPKKSTKVGTRLLLVFHTTIPSLIYSIFLGAFFQRDLRSQLSAGAEHTAVSLLQGYPKMLQLSNSLLSIPSKPSRSEMGRQHRQNTTMKAIKHDGVMAAA